VLTGVLAVGACLTLVAAASAQPAGTMIATVITASATFSAANLPAWPVLEQGNNSFWPAVTVRSLQYLLNAHGARLEVDGVFGRATAAAVREFQRAHGLVVDGVVGEQTWSALVVRVHSGSVGQAVKAVQEQSSSRHLTPDGAPALEIDGVFGPRTDEWVRQFQTLLATNTPTPVDGIVGPVTWQALIAGVFAE
jgi:peptidoglycan hydrolase-like protein with peptidoglycan-binding domain